MAARDDLSAAIGAPVPDGVAALDDARLAELATVVRDARSEQRRVLRQATEESLRHVPRLVRPAVKRIVGL